jgi:hypothetical protein
MALDVFSSVRNLFKPEDLTIDNFVFQVNVLKRANLQKMSRVKSRIHFYLCN